MTTITDDYMRQMMAQTRDYTVLILRKGPKYGQPGAEKIIWEHGRHNFELRAEGILPIVCPVRDGTETAGIGVLTRAPDEVHKIMEEDPAVKAGILVYEVHPCRSFPGSALPKE
jgi:hypothetical protein